MKNVQRILAAALALGIACFACRAYGVSLAITVPTASAFVVALFLYTFFTSEKNIKRSIAAVFLAAAFCVLGTFGGGALSSKRASSEALVSDEEHVLECRVDETLYSESYGSAVVATVLKKDGADEKIKVYVRFSFENELCENDVFIASGTFTELDEYARFYDSDGVYVAFDASTAEYVSTDAADVFDSINDFRNTLSAKLSSLVGGKEGRIASALALGDRSGVSAKQKLDFKRAGASHIIAISGMHLSVIIIALRLMLKSIGRKKLDIILMAVTLFYMALTGFSPSVCRAGIMMILFLTGDLIGEKSDGITSLFIAAALILAIWPNAVYGAGLWLSCAASLGILVVVPAFKMTFLFPKKTDGKFKAAMKSAAKYVLTLIVASAAAQLFTLPVLFCSFGGISAFAAVSGIVLIPLAEIALALSLITCVFSFVPVLSVIFAALARLPLLLITAITGKISSIEGAYVSITQPFAIYVIAAGAALVAAILLAKKLDRRLILAVGAATVIAFCVCLAVFNGIRVNETDMIYSVSGTSESVTVSSGGNVFVIDSSTGGYAALGAAVDNVNSLYAEEIDYLILTHLHVNHISSIKRLITYIKVNHIVLPTAETENDALVIRNITLAVGDEVDVTFYNRAEDASMEVGDVKIILPRYATLKRSAHPVIAFAVEENGYRVSYVGSSAVEAKNEYVNDIYQNSDCVIAAVHGPKSSAPLPLRYTAAQTVVVGGDAETVDTDGWSGEPIFAADKSGTVHIKFENK